MDISTGLMFCDTRSEREFREELGLAAFLHPSAEYLEAEYPPLLSCTYDLESDTRLLEDAEQDPPEKALDPRHLEEADLDGFVASNYDVLLRAFQKAGMYSGETPEPKTAEEAYALLEKLEACRRSLPSDVVPWEAEPLGVRSPPACRSPPLCSPGLPTSAHVPPEEPASPPRRQLAEDKRRHAGGEDVSALLPQKRRCTRSAGEVGVRAPVQDKPPKKRPGRPPKAANESAPKPRRGRPPKTSPPRGRGRPRKSGSSSEEEEEKGRSSRRTGQCPKCLEDASVPQAQKDYVFERLDRHMERQHGTKKFKCSVCAKTFNQEVILKNHLQTHPETRDESKVFPCPHCGKPLSRKDKLKEHLLICVNNFVHRASERHQRRKRK